MQFFKSKNGLRVRSIQQYQMHSYIVQTFTYIGTHYAYMHTERVMDFCIEHFIIEYNQCADDEFFQFKNKVEEEVKKFEAKSSQEKQGYYLIQTAELVTA